jgi:hypothetical protein
MKGHEKYGELAPDAILDTMKERIAFCIAEKSDYSQWLRRIVKINGKIPEHIKVSVESDAVDNVVSKIEAIIKSPAYNNAAVVSQILIAACQSMGMFDFTVFERRLRRVKSRVFLLGLPTKELGNGQLSSRVPHNATEMENALWVCMNGQAERNATLARHKIGLDETDIENRLVECGLLMAS